MALVFELREKALDKKIWLSQYLPGVPDTINPDAFSSLSAMFEKYVTQYANKPIFLNYGVTLTYAQMKVSVDIFAAFLQQHLGLKKGDRFAVMMPNLLQYPIAIFAALKAGLIVVNVNPMYTACELEKQLSDAGVTGIIVLESFADRLQVALPNTQVKHIIIAKLGDMLGTIKGGVMNILLRYVKGKVPDYHLPNAIFFKKAMKLGESLQFQSVPLNVGDIAFLQYTGGTTGRSKGAILTHRNMLANVLQCASWIRGIEGMQKGMMVGALPMYHIFALTVCGMCIMPMGASTVLVTNPRDTKAFINAIKNVQFTMMIGLNTLFNSLLNHPWFNKIDFSHTRLTVSGGTAMQRAVAELWYEKTGLPVLEGYGLTEASPVLTLCPTNVNHFTGSVGVPVPSTDVEIRNDDRQPVPLGTQGEIWAKGPQVMQGYWHQEAETRAVLDDNGWLRTGDIGYLDERGFLYIVDRKKDMVLVSGFNVYPNEVEDVLVSHPGVLIVAVIGVPSEKTGEALHAFVVRKDPDLTEAELKTFCRQSLTAYKVPKNIEFRTELPMSNVGKVLRRALRDEFEKNQSS